MNDEHPRTNRVRTALIISAIIVVAAAVLVLVAHAPFVRSAALRYAIAVVQRNYGLTVQASRLDYNLATLRVGLAGLRVSAEDARGEPFFEADYLSVVLPARILIGDVAFNEVGVTAGRVFVHRRADGTANLPRSEDSPGNDPPALRVGRAQVQRLAIDVQDDEADLALRIPALGFVLTPDEGSIALETPGELRLGAVRTRIAQLRGQASFDGRALHLSGADIRTDEGAMTVDASIVLIARESSLDLTARGSADLAVLARWGIDAGEVPQGGVLFQATVVGPLGAPDASVEVTSDRIAWRNVVLTGMSARARVNADVADIETLRFGFSNGIVMAAGALPFDAQQSAAFNATWSGIDAARLTATAVPDATLLPSATAAGRMDLRGVLRDSSSWSGAVRMQLASGSNARGRIAVGGDLNLDLQGGEWRLEGRPRIAGVAPLDIQAEGALPGTGGSPSRLIGMVRLEETRLPALMSALRAAGVIDAPADAITSGLVEANFELGGRLEAPSIEGQIVATDVAGAQVSAESVTASVSGQPLEPLINLQFDAPALLAGGQVLNAVNGSAVVNRTSITLNGLSAIQPGSTGELTGRGTYDTDSQRFTVQLAAADWQVVPTEDQPISGRVNLGFSGEGTVETPRGQGTLTLRDARWRQTTLGAVDASVDLAGRSALIEARAPDFDATVAARVALDAPYAATLTANTGRLDLARALQGIDTPAPVSGTVGLAIRFDGPFEAWRSGSATLDVTSLDATAGQLPLRLASAARVRYAGERMLVDSLEVDAGETRLSAAGELDAFEPSRASAGVLVTLTGDVSEVARAAAATGITEIPVEGGTGPVALLARITGSLESPLLAADLEAGPGSIALKGMPPVSALVLRAHAENGWFELREGTASYEQAAFEVTGRAPLSWLIPAASGPAGEAVVRARATNLTAAALAPFIDAGTAEQLEGAVDASLDVVSTAPELAAVAGELRLDRLDVRIADLPVTQRVPTRIVARDGFARVEAWDWVGQGATLNVRGQVRLEDREAAILADGIVDLRMLTPFVRDAGMTTTGRLEPRLSITGPLDDPRVDGDIALTAAEVRLADPRVIASDLTARGAISRSSATITALTGTVNGGTLRGSGEVAYSADEGLDVRLSTSIGGMALELPQGLRSEVDAALDLDLQILPDPSGRLSGTVTVVRGSYREPLAVVTGLLAGMRANRLAAGGGAGGRSPILEGLALDVQLQTDEDISVNNNYGRFELGGDLRLVGTAAAPSLTGRADLREGGQLFVGRNVYTVTSGTIDFANPDVIEPILHINASTRAGGEDIEVAIDGPAESFSPSFSAPNNPDLGQADLVALLLTGRTFDELAPGDAAFVGTQVLGNLSGEVLGFASRAVGLDTIRLGGPETTSVREDPYAAATDIDPTTRVTFGKSIGADLELTFSQSLRDGDAQTWIVEYLPARGLELRLVSDDEDLRSYGFRHDVAFGGPPRPARTARPATAMQPVTMVNVSGDLGLPEERVQSVLGLGAGDRFDFVEWQADRDRLEALYFGEGYLTARIVPERSESQDGVALEYRIAAGPMTSIVATGIELTDALRGRLEVAWTQSAFDDFLQDEAAQIVREALAGDRYLQPAIEVRVSDESAAKILSITVDRGPQTDRTTVQVEGADEVMSAAIVDGLAERGLIEQAVSNPAAIEQDAADYLRRQGYLQGRVTAGAPLFEGSTAILPLNVAAGPSFSIATISFEGGSRLDENSRREAVALTEGDPYDAFAVDSARDRLAARYRRAAFASARVIVRPDIRPDTAQVNVTFVIDEGAQQVVGDISVAGNRVIDADVIVRTLALESGTPLQPEALLQARTRLLDMGLFRRVDIESEMSPEPRGADPAGQPVLPIQLRVTVEEWPALRLRYGVEIAEERPEGSVEGRNLTPGLSADVTRRTVFGRAITLRGVAEWQRRERVARGIASVPTFFGLAVGSSLLAERSREDSAAVSLVTDRSRITWEQRTRVARSLGLSYAYTFERNHTYATEPPSPGLPVFDLTINIARLTAAIAWDTRDDPSDSTRGTFASLSLENAPASAGSDIRFVRELAQAYHFRQWRGVVFASAARVGAVSPLGGQDLIISERFFAGGARTVRGVAEDALGPQDFLDQPEGGRLLIVLNQELRLPIYRWLRGVAFVDAGNVFASPRDADLRDLTGSIGFGLRLATPFTPLLRIDFAKPVWGEQTGSSGRWIFGIGQAF